MTSRLAASAMTSSWTSAATPRCHGSGLDHARRRSCCEAAGEIMTTPPGTQVRPVAETAGHGVRLLPPARYRHPGDVIRLIIAGLVLAGALAVTITTHATYAGASAAAVTALTPPALAGRVLAGVVQAVLVTAAAAALVATLRHRRFRLLAGLAGAAVLASAGVAGADDGRPLFVKGPGSDHRDGGLLSRAYGFIRLREVGDTRPAASLIQAVEHQALAAVLAQRAGVAVPAVRQVIKTGDGSALLAMDRVDGSSLDQTPVQRLSDTMLRKTWEQVDRLHRARIAHRSLRPANIVADGTGRPWVVDFSFSELGATQRQMALDVAELLASLAAIIGADRAVAAAAAVIGPDAVAA